LDIECPAWISKEKVSPWKRNNGGSCTAGLAKNEWMRNMTDGNDSEDRKGIISSFYKAAKSFGSIFPILLGVILLLGLFRAFVSNRMISAVFTGDLLRDTVFASIVGSISAGNAVTSYIIGGELLKEGISLIAATAFMVAWATVGVIQFPAEAAILGKRFAAARNAVCFILSILVAIVTVKTLMMIQ
jgi:uncharacterized membrane protein YraQ (UPF0718 family)